MIARHEVPAGQSDLWTQLAAPLTGASVTWRSDGCTVEVDGRFFARLFPALDVRIIRDRLDSIVPGEWNLTLEALPMPALAPAAPATAAVALKARLQILGVVREDTGTGSDYQSAADEAFTRVAARYGIGHELGAGSPAWVEMDGMGPAARPVEEPAAAAERQASRAPATSRTQVRAAPRSRPEPASESATSDDPLGRSGSGVGARPGRTLSIPRAPLAGDVPPCPVCGGRMWDNRLGKRNPKAPDFKCRDRSCNGVVWPPRGTSPNAGGPAPAGGGSERGDVQADLQTDVRDAPAPVEPRSLALGDPDIPF